MDVSFRLLRSVVIGVLLLWSHRQRVNDLGPAVIKLPRTLKNMAGLYALLLLGLVLSVVWCFLVGFSLVALAYFCILTGWPLVWISCAGRLHDNGLHTFGTKVVFWMDVEWFDDMDTLIRLRLIRKGNFYGYFDIPTGTEEQKKELLAFLREKGVSEKEKDR